MRICFVSQHFRRFNSETLLTEPMGGTESTLIGLAKALAAAGVTVSVYSQCQGLEGVYAGVRYAPLPQLMADCQEQAPDFLIVLNGTKHLLKAIPARYTLWWGHNDYSHIWEEMPDFKAEVVSALSTHADKLLVLSQWQQSILSQHLHIPPEHFWVSPYGIDLHDFPDPLPAIPPRLIYTSAPNRGLHILLQLFPKLKAQIPELELHIYSSLSVWSGGKEAWEDHKTQRVLRHAEQQPGMFVHRPQAKPALYKALSESTLWTYPNQAAWDSFTWGETFCLAALEAQAAGLPVITSARGALPETVSDQVSGILIPGDPASECYQQAFIDATLSLLNNPERRKQMAQQARARIQQDFNWQKIAQHWLHLFTHFESTRMAISPYSSPFPHPLMTVIVWSVSPTLRDTLTTLTQQDWQNFDVVILNALPDILTPEEMQRFRQQLNLRYRTPETLEMELHEMVRGQVALFIESDMVLPPGCLQAHWRAHQVPQAAAIYSSYTYRAEALSPEANSLTLNPDRREELGLFTPGCSVTQALLAEPGGFSLSYLSLKQLGGYRLELYPEFEALQKFAQAVAHHTLPVALLDDEGALWRQFTLERAEREQLRWQTRE